MFSYASEMYSKTLFDDLQICCGAGNDFNTESAICNVPTGTTFDSWMTPEASEKIANASYVLDDSFLRDSKNVDDIIDEITNNFTYFQSGHSDKNDDDDVLMQNWSLEDLESLWMSADLYAGNSSADFDTQLAIDGGNTKQNDDDCDELLACLSGCSSDAAWSPSSRTEPEIVTDDMSVISSPSGRLSRQSSYSSSGRSSISGNLWDDDQLSANQLGAMPGLTLAHVGSALPVTAHRRHSSFGSSREWQQQVSLRLDESNVGGLDRGGKAKKRKNLTRHLSFGSTDLLVPANCEDAIADSEFIRLLLQRQPRIAGRHRPSDDDIDSGIGRRSTPSRHHHSHRRRNLAHETPIGRPTQSEVDRISNGHLPDRDVSRQLADNSAVSYRAGSQRRTRSSSDQNSNASLSAVTSPNDELTSVPRNANRRNPEAETNRCWPSAAASIDPQRFCLSQRATALFSPHEYGSYFHRRRFLEDHCYFSRDSSNRGITLQGLRRSVSTAAATTKRTNLMSSSVFNRVLCSKKNYGQNRHQVRKESVVDTTGSVLELFLRSSGPLSANRGSDALVAEKLGSRPVRLSSCALPVDESTTNRAATSFSSANESFSRGSTLLHRLLTADVPEVEDQTSTTDDRIEGAPRHFDGTSNAAGKMPFLDNNVAESNETRSAAAAVDKESRTNVASSEYNCNWPTDDSSLMMTETVKPGQLLINDGRELWGESAPDDEMSLEADNERWMTQYFGSVFQV